ncbi:hypothetical protein PR202_ga31492 [Eleusine coracana subsp. coracana]|uniref:Remorin C-terminal domain-containing protein n=1 Tax=Eleusine coracana subsp. coracana TaxID=191504 RepID=A0AAV5DQ41_ELECO|nr:hypothetical protein PR202_ga31492 [Eleusine coracana subsp. coracana]
MSNGEEYDAAYAATVAAVAYVIAAREEKLASKETPAAEKFASGNKRRFIGKLGSQKKPASLDERPTLKSPTTRGESLTRPLEGSKMSRRLSGREPVDDDYDDEQGANVSVRRPLKPIQKKPEGIASVDERQTAPTLKSPIKRGESLKRPIEGSKISRWLSGKEPVNNDYNDEQGANVSVRRPLKPAQKNPEGIPSGQNVVEKMIDSTPSLKKDPSFTLKPTEKKGSRRFEQGQPYQMVPPAAHSPKPTMSSYSGRGSRVAAASEVATSSEAEATADAWEKEKLAKIKKQYNETMETIAEWETEKKAKARRQKQLKDESESERKRAKALEEYNDEMSRINKVAAASRLTVEEKKRNAETKVREKADKIRSTGKLPSTCGCF